jgi:hypothetical protein
MNFPPPPTRNPRMDMPPVPTRNPGMQQQPQGFFGGNGGGMNMGLILGGIAGMSGANPAQYYGMGKSFDDERRKRAMRSSFMKALEDPELAAAIPQSVKAMLPYMEPEAAARTVMQHQLKLREMKQRASMAQASGGGASYGKTGAIFQGGDGRFYSVQFGSDGSRKVLPFDDKMAPARGVQAVGDELIDKSTGQPVRGVGDALRRAENQRAIGAAEGKSTAEARSDLPRAIDDAEDAIKTIDAIKNHPNRAIATGNSYYLPTVRASTREFYAFVDQLRGKVFLDAFKQLKGGGHITEAEGQKAQQARARLREDQSEEGFLKGLQDLREIIERGVRRAKQAAGKSNGGGAAPKRMRYNPATGVLDPL